MKRKGDNKQIPTWLYLELEAWADGSDVPNLREHVAHVMKEKRNNIEQHLLYSAYKDKSRPEDEREIARQLYLERKGIPNSFRWNNGDNNDNN